MLAADQPQTTLTPDEYARVMLAVQQSSTLTQEELAAIAHSRSFGPGSGAPPAMHPQAPAMPPGPSGAPIAHPPPGTMPPGTMPPGYNPYLQQQQLHPGVVGGGAPSHAPAAPPSAEPVQLPRFPPLESAEATGDKITIKTTMEPPNWRVELKDASWNMCAKAVADTPTIVYRLKDAEQRTLKFRMCTVNPANEELNGEWTEWMTITSKPEEGAVVVVPAPPVAVVPAPPPAVAPMPAPAPVPAPVPTTITGAALAGWMNASAVEAGGA